MKHILSAYKAQEFIKPYVSVPKCQLIKQLWQVKLKLPLVLKLISPKLIHKSDIDGVKIAKTPGELKKSFNELIKTAKRKKINIEGILVQEFCEGQELIIGIKKDPTFNHMIIFGLGGIFTEVLKDTSTRKCPITIDDIEEMLSELKSKAILQGYRGKKLNLSLLKQTLLSLSELPSKYKNIQELDINPFILNSKEGKAVDVRIVFETK